MPHLQFDLDFSPPPEEKRRFGETVVRRFGEIMETGTDHVAVILRCHPREELVFGRAADARGAVLVNADIRRGRTVAQKRELALMFVEEAHHAWSVPRKAVYVVFTEHDGENFQLEEKVLPTWTPGEDPLAR
jgi:hypothetical protein